MVQVLGPQAHFDPLAKPSLFDFRGTSYLRIPLITTLAAADSGSQYRLAALAFDRHVSHLIPVGSALRQRRTRIRRPRLPHNRERLP